MSRVDYFGAPAHLRQQRCDRVVATYRTEQSGRELGVPRPSIRRDEPVNTVRKSIRREAPPLPAALAPTANATLLRVGEELEYARRMLDTMGAAVTSDPSVVARHGTSLQAVDIIGQMLGHLATVVRSNDPAQAVERIGMAELKARLVRRSVL